LQTSSPPDVWRVIAAEAAQESRLWSEALLPEHRRAHLAVFSPLAREAAALGIETIYEGYLLHYGRPRLFGPLSEDVTLLLGDYLYAHGLVRIASLEQVEAVADLAALISLCGQLRADGRPGEGPAWAATAALLGTGRLEAPREALRVSGDARPLFEAAASAAGPAAVRRALVVHAGRVG